MPDSLTADVDSCSIKELKAIIGAARLSTAGCFEKSELRDRAREAQAKLKAEAKAKLKAEAKAKLKAEAQAKANAEARAKAKAALSPAMKAQRMNEAVLLTGMPPQFFSMSGGAMLPLVYAGVEGKLEAAEALLDAGAPIDKRDSKGCGALLCAAQNGHFDVCQLLISRGANPLLTACDGSTPIYQASAAGYVDIVKLLVENYPGVVDPNASIFGHHGLGCPPINAAADHGRLAVVKYLAEECAVDIDIKAPYATPLVMAAGKGFAVIVKYLLSRGACAVYLKTLHEQFRARQTRELAAFLDEYFLAGGTWQGYVTAMRLDWARLRCRWVSPPGKADTEEKVMLHFLFGGTATSSVAATTTMPDFLTADVDSCSVKELKAIIGAGLLSTAGCFEKSELRARAREAQAKLKGEDEDDHGPRVLVTAPTDVFGRIMGFVPFAEWPLGLLGMDQQSPGMAYGGGAPGPEQCRVS